MTSVWVAFVLIFVVVQLCTAEYVVYGQKMTLDNNLSLNPNQCHHPLITQLTLDSKNLLLFSFVRELWASRIVCRNDELSFIMFY